jgi:hypothetical protein
MPPSTYALARLDFGRSSMPRRRSGAKSRSPDLHRSTAGSCGKHRIPTRILGHSISRSFGILLSPAWARRRAFAPSMRLPASPYFTVWALRNRPVEQAGWCGATASRCFERCNGAQIGKGR